MREIIYYSIIFITMLIFIILGVKDEKIRYFQFKEPRIIVYKDLAPTVWCIIESRKILRGEIPFNYKKDTK